MRLIPDPYFRPPVLGGLVDTEEELAALADPEGLTNERLRAETTGLDDLDRSELAFKAISRALGDRGTSYINAAFSHSRPTGNRFNDARRGAWYCAFDEFTAIEEVAFHRTRELRFIGHFEDEMPYQGLLADFLGTFPDIRGHSTGTGCLDPDPGVGYRAGQEFVRSLRAEGWSELVYSSVRRRGGTCLVTFEPRIVQNVRPGANWLLR